jgi:hypothetical protein
MKTAEFQFEGVTRYGKVNMMESTVNTEKGNGDFLQIMIPLDAFDDQLITEGENAGETRKGMVSIQRKNKDGESKCVRVGDYIMKLFVMKADEDTESIF